MIRPSTMNDLCIIQMEIVQDAVSLNSVKSDCKHNFCLQPHKVSTSRYRDLCPNAAHGLHRTSCNILVDAYERACLQGGTLCMNYSNSRCSHEMLSLTTMELWTDAEAEAAFEPLKQLGMLPTVKSHMLRHILGPAMWRGGWR